MTERFLFRIVSIPKGTFSTRKCTEINHIKRFLSLCIRAIFHKTAAAAFKLITHYSNFLNTESGKIKSGEERKRNRSREETLSGIRRQKVHQAECVRYS